MNINRLLLILAFLLCGSCNYAYAQTAQQCPPDMVCLTREAALKAISDADTVKAQAEQIKTLEKAVSDLKDELQKMREEYVRSSTEASDLKQQQVRDAAIIELLLKYARPKKVGLINLF